MANTHDFLVDLQSKLLEDSTGLHRRSILARLSELQSACSVAKRQLNERETYTKLIAATTALAGAARVIKNVASRGQKGN